MHKQIYCIGGHYRQKSHVDCARKALSSSWGCNSREDIINTIERMTDNGHNSSFEFEAKFINSLSNEEYDELLKNSNGMDTYMWPLVKNLNAKWGDKGIKAWDWFRMAHLAAWGYIAGYLELEETYMLVEPIAQRVKDNFSSWDEATENYLDGYAYWSRTDISEEDTEYKKRVKTYEDIKDNAIIFDRKVWGQPVIGIEIE